jgi:hypothetical protein
MTGSGVVLRSLDECTFEEDCFESSNFPADGLILAPGFALPPPGDFEKNDVIEGCRNGAMPFTFQENTRSRWPLRGVICLDGIDGASDGGAESL